MAAPRFSPFVTHVNRLASRRKLTWNEIFLKHEMVFHLCMVEAAEHTATATYPSFPGHVTSVEIFVSSSDNSLAGFFPRAMKPLGSAANIIGLGRGAVVLFETGARGHDAVQQCGLLPCGEI